MTTQTFATQQAAVAAAARPFSGLGHGYVSNNAMGACSAASGTMTWCKADRKANKRPARHLGIRST